MANNQNNINMTALEIASLASKLTPNNQAYLLHTINTLLLSQQTAKLNYQSKKERKLLKSKDKF